MNYRVALVHLAQPLVLRLNKTSTPHTATHSQTQVAPTQPQAQAAPTAATEDIE